MATCIVALSTHTLKVVRFSQPAMNQPGQSGKGLLQFGGFAMIFSFLMMIFENWEISIFSCFGGIFSLVAGAIMAGSAALTGADDQKMVLKQGADGSWGWVNSDGSPVNTNIPGVINQASAAQYNDQSTQIAKLSGNLESFGISSTGNSLFVKFESSVYTTFNGFLATVIQHENDHLDGKLITDYATPSDLLKYDKALKSMKSLNAK